VTYEGWEEQVPQEIRGDPLWEMKAYRLALFLHDLAWENCARLAKDRRGKAMAAMASQLIRSAGSVSANIEEGYGRGLGRQFNSQLPRRLRFTFHALRFTFRLTSQVLRDERHHPTKTPCLPPRRNLPL
jgi:hypothetical protein